MNSLEFKNPMDIIYIIIPAAALVILILSARKKDRILAALRIGIKPAFKALRTVLAVFGLTLMLAALLGPQVFRGYAEVQSHGLDIYILMDTSKSMQVKDVEPDRISRAKKIAGSIIDNLKGDRVGFIPFSSDSYIQMPLTDDYQVARMFLDVMDTNMISGGGTDIGSAIKLASSSFDRSSSADRVIIILSDGEEHESGSLEALKAIKDDKLKVFAVGTGTEKGGLVPVYDDNNQRITEYKKDQNGNYVTSILMADSLKQLAAAGRGTYYQSTVSGNEIQSLIKDISSLKRDVLNTKKISRFTHIYQYFLGAGLLLFLLSAVLPEKRRT